MRKGPPRKCIAKARCAGRRVSRTLTLKRGRNEHLIPSSSCDKRKASILKVTTKGKETSSKIGRKITCRDSLLIIGVKVPERGSFPEAARLVRKVSCLIQRTLAVKQPVTVGLDFKGGCNSRGKSSLLRACVSVISSVKHLTVYANAKGGNGRPLRRKKALGRKRAERVRLSIDDERPALGIRL